MNLGIRHSFPQAILAGVILLLAGTQAAGQGKPSVALPTAAAPARTVLVSERTFWRKHYTLFRPVYAAEVAVAATQPAGRKAPVKFFTDDLAPPPAGWTGGDFDDGTWLLRRGREFVCGDGRAMEYLAPDATNAYLRSTDGFIGLVGLIAQRARFVVSDRGQVGKLAFSLTYRGGFVAYLNGREVARASLPAGPIDPTTPAETYPLEAFFVTEAGGKVHPLHWFNDRQSTQWPLRERTFGPVEIPSDALRPGVNVLAVEFHRSAYPDECRKAGLCFAALGLSLLELKASPPAGAAAPAPLRRLGLQVWPVDVTRAVSDRICPNYDERLGAVRLVGARNGVFSGQVMVASERPLAGLSASVSGLKGAGEGSIPASAIQVRYAVANPLWGAAGLGYPDTVLPAEATIDRTVFLGRRLDMLLDAPPEEPSAVGVWTSVTVPRNVPPGRYEGELTVAATGAEPVKVPMELTLADWTLPDVKDYASLINIYQSPDTLADYYKVKCWSDEHFRLIEKSLKLMGGMGNVGLFVPLLAESQMGNPESMVVWTRQPDPSTGSGPAGGSYKYDFSAFDRYLEAALRYHDRLWFVALNVWGYEARRDAAQVTVADAAGGKSLMKLPAYGTAECEALWRPLISALRDRLKARGLEGKILFGLPSDAGPPPAHAAMFHNILPGAGWIAESHMHIGGYVYDPAAKASVPVKYNSIVWGGEVPDPGVRRLYGWRHPNDRLTMNFNRAGTECLVLLGYPSPWAFRMWMESTLACGRNGNGRVGGDYWRMGVKLVGGAGSSEAVGGSGGTRFGMYLSSGTGQTGLGNSTSDLFAPAPDGLVSTVRLENAREGNQESEARIFIEKALLDKARPLPADLAARCQHLLDERTNTLRLWAMGASALAPYRWQERNLGLFSAAGEVAKTLSAMPASAPAGATAVR